MLFAIIWYIIDASFSKEIFRKGGILMNQADLIWRLVEELIHKENELNQLATDKAQAINTPNDQQQNEA